MTMETKTCKVCGRELPENNFRVTRWGGRADTCNECIKAARRETRAQKKAQQGGVTAGPFPTRTSTARNHAKSLTL